MLFVLLCFLRQGLTVQPRLACNSPSSCLRILSTGTTGVHHHTRQKPVTSKQRCICDTIPAVPRHYRLGGSNNRNLLPHISGD
jgi:hypothetical protein